MSPLLVWWGHAGGEMGCLTEDTALGFVDGTLPPAARAAIERHLDECRSCRALVGELGVALAPRDADSAADSAAAQRAPGSDVLPAVAPLVRGSSVGRYLVLQPLGAGGMSAVYLAFDPELDRRIALKLVRPDVADAAMREEVRTRLLREAQALARLSHPNVVAVHDAGSHGDQVFIAMELVRGDTIREWLRAGPRTWREIAAVFLQAGAGLAAAHAAGLVHRDFKPANVLVGEDGQVRVADFGLARLLAVVEPAPTSAVPADDAASELVTQRGRIVGTPAYMAPEQREGRPADARSDQFSFCVALHEALYGQRPLLAASGAASSTEAARPRPAARRGRAVPARVRAVLRRGLRESPADRYPGMPALLADLARCAAPRWRRPLGIALLVGVLAAGGVAYRGHWVRERDRCRGFAARLAGVWDGGRRESVRVAFLATGRADAEAAFARAAARLDEHAAAWVTARAAACEGMHGTAAAAELETLRAQCLDWQLEVTRALTDVLTRADANLVARSRDIADRLLRLDRCAAGDRLARRPRLPLDPATRPPIDETRARVVRSAVLSAAGHYRDADEEARAAAAAAQASGFRPLEAEAWYLAGYCSLQLGRLDAAEDALWQAVRVGKACGHDEPAAAAWADLAWLTGFSGPRSPQRLALAERYGEQAAAAVERMGGDTFLEGKIKHTLSVIAMVQGRFRPAEERARAAIALLGESEVGRSQLPAVQQLCGLVLGEQGRLTEGLALQDLALAGVAAQVGRSHPRFASQAVERAGLLAGLGRHDEALAAALEALGLARSATAPQEQVIAQALDFAGLSLAARGRLDEALAHHREALARLERAVGPDDPRTGVTRQHLGTALRLRGQPVAARAEQQRACAVLERAAGPRHPLTAACLHELALTLLAQGHAAAALPHLERALDARQQAAVRPADLAATRFALAQALTGARQRPDHARALAAQARAEYDRAEGEHRAAITAVERWLEQHRGR